MIMQMTILCLSQTRNVVEIENENIILWFGINNKQANPEKVQAIVLGRKAYDGCKSFRVSGTDILPRYQ